MKNIYTREVANNIVEAFEDLLEENDITIPDEDREGNDDEARLYGTTYDNLLTNVESMVVELMKRCGVSYRAGIWNGGKWIE